MLPLVVARQLEAGVQEFLRATFPATTPGFRGTGGDESFLTRFLAVDGALSKGPWLEIKLPFRQAAEGAVLPLKRVLPKRRPWQHQLRAFERLTGPERKSTIVATGTGSGKTECFLYPLLEHCLGDRKPGIKAIVIYPMNALAADQARRFARECHALTPKLSVGLYTGDGGESRDMGPDTVITDRATLRAAPPDILLTNYKMLDFLMVRPSDQELWRFNTPGRLQFVVVDELHTFDGAQGTDLACLLRRLRSKLGAGPELVYAGTSATLGGPETLPEMRDYASRLFGAAFDEQSVVVEDRLGVDEYLAQTAGDGDVITRWPTDAIDLLAVSESPATYLAHAAEAWLGQPLPFDSTVPARRREAALTLGKRLPRSTAFQELLRATRGVTDLAALSEAWQQRHRLEKRADAQRLVDSLCALIAAARIRGAGGGAPNDELEPFLHVRVQLWFRELRRMVAPVSEAPTLVHADEVPNLASPLHLPVLHCRQCHAAAWGAVWRPGERQLEFEVQTFYQAWFRRHPDARFVYPAAARPRRGAVGPEHRLCPSCRAVSVSRAEEASSQCERCAEPTLAVWIPDVVQRIERHGVTTSEVLPDCPLCDAPAGISLVGSRATSLSSVLIGDLFGSAYNGDNKLIAFSDSVQDAAHRSGFFGARTYRQVVRAALARLIRDTPDGLRLDRLADELPKDCLRRLGSDADFAATYIAPDLEYLRGYQDLRRDGLLGHGSDLPDLVSKRLRWEALLEFGMRSRIGRTLERLGVACVSPDDALLRKTAAALARTLREEIGTLRDVETAAVEAFLRGIITRFRQVGALYDPLLDSYLQDGGNAYLLQLLRFLPGYGPRNPAPPAVSLRYVSSQFETLVGKTRWYPEWFNKCLAEAQPLATADFDQAYALTMRALEQASWLTPKVSRGTTVWGLDTRRFTVLPGGRDLACDRCGHRVPVALRDDAYLFPCLRPGCAGRLRPAPGAARQGLFKMAPHRLVPREHTALLSGDERHEIEQSFIRGDRPWDVNLLSATPTLEMGIDIGALSTVLLCSVPPAQTNYVQRIGRAGRRDGNALALTVAGGSDHDNYFYSAPLELIAGRVPTPGVFLRAIAVLERQLIAFCFDRWAVSGVAPTAIPGKLRDVLNAVAAQTQSAFPYTLLRYADLHAQDLVTDFVALFPELDEDAREHLREFILGGRSTGSLGWRVLNRLTELEQMRQSHKSRMEALKKRVKELEKQPADEARDELLRACRDERSASADLLSELNDRSTLNFFTDEGLLPNYAFPEEGVTLSSVILKRRSRVEGAKSESGGREKTYESVKITFQRAAQSALSELAPDATFYASEHKLRIERVDLHTSRPTSWRLCPECHFSENVDESGDVNSVCPRCGSAMWADEGQRRTMLRLRQVFAKADSKTDRIGDESDDRDPKFFRRQLLVDIGSHAAQRAFRLASPELPFGFEYVAKARFREINFGDGGDASNTFKVAGRSEPRRGFALCQHCGMVRRKRLSKGQYAHALECPMSRNVGEDPAGTWLDSLYLYRELESEAIRILLPLADVAESEVGRRSFAAALRLGLRRRFRGNVDHIEMTDMQAPAGMGEAGLGRRQFLVLYDRIPGGTGYLKELMSAPEKLMDVFQAALDHVTTCECVDDPGRDGCYRCLLAYRDSRNMASISRRTAESLLRKILDRRALLQPVADLADVAVNVLFGSPLEARFVEALQRLPQFLVTKRTVGGKAGCWISPRDGEGGVVWELEPQVALGASEGVVISTVPDFVLRPVREAERARFGEWALYLDGFGPHHAITADDTRKRLAVLRSGRRVWTLTYADVPEPGAVANEPITDGLTRHLNPAWLGIYGKLAERYGWPSPSALDAFARLGPFDALVKLMRDPVGLLEWLQFLPIRNAIGWLHKPSLDGPLFDSPAVGGAEVVSPRIAEVLRSEDELIGLGGLLPGLQPDSLVLRALATVPKGALQSRERLVSEVGCHLWLDDDGAAQTADFERHWRAFWHAANGLQDAPAFSIATRLGLADGVYEGIAGPRVRASVAAAISEAGPVLSPEWADVVEQSRVSAGDLSRLAGAGLPPPEVGMDLRHGIRVVGTAELEWAAQHVAVIAAGDELEASPDGWVIISTADVDWTGRVIAAIGQRTEGDV